MPKVPPQPKGRPRPTRFDAFAPGAKGGAGAYVFIPEGEFDAHVLGGAPQYHKGMPLPPQGPPPRGFKGCGKGPMQPFGPPAQMAPMAPMNMDKIYSRAHDAITTSVWEIVQEIKEFLENAVEADVAKKVTRYMYKAISNPELTSMPFEELCAEFVKGMFNGYSAACGEASWFFQLDLTPALSAAALVLLPALGHRIPPHQVYETLQREFQINLDRMTLDKAMWQMVESIFGDDDNARKKIFAAISRAYDPALKMALANPTPMEDIQRVEIFTKHWIDDAACRSWGGLQDNAEALLNHETLVEMFDHLLQPFGDDHPFSAIPRELTESIGAPPRGWDFIPQVVDELFQNWNNPGSVSKSSKKRKRKGGGGGDDEAQEEYVPLDESAGLSDFKVPVARGKARKAKKASSCVGHPECTSGPDCAGGPEEGLVQHILEDGPGDRYCEVCWNSFKQRNPELEGIPVEE